MVVIAFDPDDLHVTLWVRELEDESEELPVLFFKPGKIQVGKDIAVQDQTPILMFLQNTHSTARAAHIGAEVQIRQNQRVVDMRAHDSIVSKDCYRVMNQRTFGRLWVTSQ